MQIVDMYPIISDQQKNEGDSSKKKRTSKTASWVTMGTEIESSLCVMCGGGVGESADICGGGTDLLPSAVGEQAAHGRDRQLVGGLLRGALLPHSRYGHMFD